jgi:tyramine---L-glutamate ligase
MRILIFEWFVGGGLLAEDRVSNSLLREGRAMRDAIAQDFVRCGHRVLTLQDFRIPTGATGDIEYHSVDSFEDVRLVLEQLAKQAEKVLLIAPEIGGCLSQVAQWLSKWEDKLISPKGEFMRIASDKHLTRQRFSQHNVPIPDGFLVQKWDHQTLNQLPDPAVIKPVDGCGSEGIVYVAGKLNSNVAMARPAIVESYIPGIPASVAAICNRNGIRFLPPVQQVFDRFPIGAFIDCVCPIDVDLQERAISLAERAMNAMPVTCGYVGIDLVLADQGFEHDVVIEVNPRFTSSYLKLREICDFSIADQMLA